MKFGFSYNVNKFGQMRRCIEDAEVGVVESLGTGDFRRSQGRLMIT